MKRIYVLLLTFGLLSGLVVQSQIDFAALEGNPVRGREAYLQNACYSCHGIYGETATAPLNPPRLSQAAFVIYVRNPPEISTGPWAMRAFDESTISDQGLVDIFAYLASEPQP